MPANEKALEDIIQIVYDKMAGVDLPSGDYDDVIRREVERSVKWVETKTKTSISPVRFTNLPKNPQDAYEDRLRYIDFLSNPMYVNFPTWDQLTPEQRVLYGNDPANYKDGTLPWELLTEEQRIIFTSLIKYAPNKVGNAERQDGKGSPFIVTYYWPIVTVYYFALSFIAPPGQQDVGKQIWFRLYKPDEFIVYHQEGAIHIFPAVMQRLSSETKDPLYGARQGVVAPRIPQVVEIDYEYGFVDPPETLLEAVACRAITTLILNISSMYTAGLSGFGVEGFNASFKDGILYRPLYDECARRAEDLTRMHTRLVLSAW